MTQSAILFTLANLCLNVPPSHKYSRRFLPTSYTTYPSPVRRRSITVGGAKSRCSTDDWPLFDAPAVVVHVTVAKSPLPCANPASAPENVALVDRPAS